MKLLALLVVLCAFFTFAEAQTSNQKYCAGLKDRKACVNESKKDKKTRRCKMYAKKCTAEENVPFRRFKALKKWCRAMGHEQGGICNQQLGCGRWVAKDGADRNNNDKKDEKWCNWNKAG